MMIKRTLFLITLLIAAGFLSTSGALEAQAVNLQLTPSGGSHAVGQTFTAVVQVNSGAQAVNAVEATLSFDRSVLQVVNVSRANSSLSLWTTEPTFSNSAGTISFAGGNPSPFSGVSTLMSVTFRVAAVGSGSVSFSSGAATAADGTGRDVLSSMSSATYTGTEAPAAPPPPPPPPPPTGNTPAAPNVSSETHPDPDGWYSSREAVFGWNLPSGVNATRLALSRQPVTTPTVVYEPAISSRELGPDVIDEDGEWYFHVQLRNQAGWGQTTHFRFRIDTVAPESFDVRVVDGEGGDRPTLEFTTTDELSGLAEYEVRVSGLEPELVSASDHADSQNRFTFSQSLPAGEVEIVLVARDQAGNETEASISVEVEESEDRVVPIIDGDEIGFWERYGSTIIITLLLLAIAGLLGYIWFIKRSFQVQKAYGKRETREVKMEVDRIFSALRGEAEELFASFDGKEGLSAKEKRAYDKLKNAIDVSEELIGKEIEDVEKTLR